MDENTPFMWVTDLKAEVVFDQLNCVEELVRTILPGIGGHAGNTLVHLAPRGFGDGLDALAA
jgi:hypothetical protein